MQEQCYAYAKQAGIKENEIDYSIIGSAQILPKLVASLEAGNPPDITRLGSVTCSSIAPRATCWR